MKRNTQSSAVRSARSTRETEPVKSTSATTSVSGGTGTTRLSSAKALEGGLLRLCHEIAGLIIRRHLAGRDSVAGRQEVTARLVHLMKCDEGRAARLIDLSLELIHVKMHGRYERTPLELSLLIAQAGNQLRDVSNN